MGSPSRLPKETLGQAPVLSDGSPSRLVSKRGPAWASLRPSMTPT